MKFDYTNGKRAKYLVMLYGLDVEDKYYYYYFKDAKERFEQLKSECLAAGRIVSISDLIKDERKAFAKA